MVRTPLTRSQSVQMHSHHSLEQTRGLPFLAKRAVLERHHNYRDSPLP